MIDVENILKILPHRYPFLLVDRVLELEPKSHIVAIKNVTCNEAFFQGHFPERKIMPGVLIVEAIAQAGGILLFKSIDDAENKFAVLSKLNDFKFKKMVVPGDQLRLEAGWIRTKGQIYHVHGRALVGSEVVAEGDLFATILDRKKLLAF